MSIGAPRPDPDAAPPMPRDTTDATSEEGSPWLVVDDGSRAPEIARSLGTSPRAYEGPDALVTAVRRSGARVVVVISPPVGPDGIDRLAALRRRSGDLRLLLIDRPAAAEERLRALGLGFDDAVPWSLDLSELSSRARRLATGDASRRTVRGGGVRIPLGRNLELDPAARALRRGTATIHLRPKEYGLLALLAAHPGRAYTRRQLLERVWGPRVASDPRTVDVHVRWLRSKIEREPRRPERLVTVRGVGYRLDLPGR